MVKIIIVTNGKNLIQEKRGLSNDNKYGSILHYLGKGEMDFDNLDIEKIEQSPNIFVVLIGDNFILKSSKEGMADNLAKPLRKENIGTVKRKYSPESFDIAHQSINKVMGIREERIYLVDLGSILYSFVEEAVVKIITEQNLIYKCKHPLKYWEERLAKHNFFMS